MGYTSIHYLPLLFIPSLHKKMQTYILTYFLPSFKKIIELFMIKVLKMLISPAKDDFISLCHFKILRFRLILLCFDFVCLHKWQITSLVTILCYAWTLTCDIHLARSNKLCAPCPDEEWYFFISKISFTFKNPLLPVCIKPDWDVLGHDDISGVFRSKRGSHYICSSLARKMSLKEEAKWTPVNLLGPKR